MTAFRSPFQCVASVVTLPAYVGRCKHRAKTLAPVRVWGGTMMSLPVCGTHARVALANVRDVRADGDVSAVLTGVVK